MVHMYRTEYRGTILVILIKLIVPTPRYLADSQFVEAYILSLWVLGAFAQVPTQ